MAISNSSQYHYEQEMQRMREEVYRQQSNMANLGLYGTGLLGGGIQQGISPQQAQPACNPPVEPQPNKVLLLCD